MMKAVIDTCVILDAIQKRQPFFEQAEKIFKVYTPEEFIAIIS